MAPPDAQALLTPMSSNTSTSNGVSGTESVFLDFDPDMVPAMCYSYTINHADGTSNFPYVSEYCETIFGFSADHLMKHPELLMNSVHKDDSEKFTKVCLLFVAGARSIVHVMVHSHIIFQTVGRREHAEHDGLGLPIPYARQG